jgi:hypothetical protein
MAFLPSADICNVCEKTTAAVMAHRPDRVNARAQRCCRVADADAGRGSNNRDDPEHFRLSKFTQGG